VVTGLRGKVKAAIESEIAKPAGVAAVKARVVVIK
jgi:hypothetical protein